MLQELHHTSHVPDMLGEELDEVGGFTFISSLKPINVAPKV